MDTDKRTVEAQASTSEFGPFFADMYPQLVKMLYLVTRDSVEAEDLAQEAMVRMYERWEKVRSLENREGYVYRVAMNLSHRRGLRRRMLASLKSNPDEAALASAAEARSEMAVALDSLPRGQREAVVLVEWLGMSSEEAAPVLGIAAASVRSRVRRARDTLRTLLEVRDV